MRKLLSLRGGEKGREEVRQREVGKGWRGFGDRDS